MPELERRFEGSEPLSGALAPEELLSRGAYLDPAEWLASFNRGDGSSDRGDGPSAAPASTTRTNTLELPALVEGWVRRLAVGGDQRRAVARLDIGHGVYAGAELVIAAEAGALSVELTLPEGLTPSVGLAERLRSRLAARGYAADVALR